MPHKDGAALAGTRTTPETAPGTPTKKPKAYAHLTPETPVCLTSRLVRTSETASSRRWTRKPSPRVTLSDAALWLFWLLITAASLIALCVVLTLAWSS